MASGDVEFFFPHLDALPVERTLAVIKPDAIAQGEKGGKTVLQVVEDEAAALGLFVVSKQPLSPQTNGQAQLVNIFRRALKMVLELFFHGSVADVIAR